MCFTCFYLLRTQAELDKEYARQQHPSGAGSAAAPDLPQLIAKLEREVQKCVSMLDPDNGELDAVQGRLEHVDKDDLPVAMLPTPLRAWLLVQLSTALLHPTFPLRRCRYLMFAVHRVALLIELSMKLMTFIYFLRAFGCGSVGTCN